MSASLGVLGSQGRMGSLVSDLIQKDFTAHARLAARADREDSPEGLLSCDAIIDFSSPEAVVSLARLALQKERKLPAFIVGSTGWKTPAREALLALSKKAPVLISSNFSMGVLALLHILKESSPLLKKLGYSPVIVETHHIHKKDNPSGTALALRAAIEPRDPSSVQTHGIRAGEVIGDHEASFYGPDDRLTFGHFAQSRAAFARGSIQAALWLCGKKQPGFFEIEDFFRDLNSGPMA